MAAAATACSHCQSVLNEHRRLELYPLRKRGVSWLLYHHTALALHQSVTFRAIPLTQGAPESVLRRCSHALANNGEGAVVINEAMRKSLADRLLQFGSSGALRCLALAFKGVGSSGAVSSASES